MNYGRPENDPYAGDTGRCDGHFKNDVVEAECVYPADGHTVHKGYPDSGEPITWGDQKTGYDGVGWRGDDLDAAINDALDNLSFWYGG